MTQMLLVIRAICVCQSALARKFRVFLTKYNVCVCNTQSSQGTSFNGVSKSVC